MKNLRRSANTKKQNMTYVILLILLVIFFATVGLRLVINTSLFIAGFSNNQPQGVKESSDNILIAPEFVDLPDATNSAQIAISGIAQGSSSVKIFINDEEQKEVKVTDDEFNTNIRLSPGENILYILTQYAKNKQTKKSEDYTVYYLSQKPKLDIIEPQNDSTVNNPEVTVKGHTDKEIIVKVNNFPAVTDQEGNFSLLTRLKEGENFIKVTAQDKAGNTETKEIKIIFSKDE